MTPKQEQEAWIKGLSYIDKIPNVPCSVEGPLHILVPREGIVISCQRHPEGHFLRPSVNISF